MKGKFCGDLKPLSMTITQSSMTVQFVSDSADSDSYTGFSLYYKANFKDDTGKLSLAYFVCLLNPLSPLQNNSGFISLFYFIIIIFLHIYMLHICKSTSKAYFNT